MIVVFLVFASLLFLIFWYVRFRFILPYNKKLEDYERYYSSFEDFVMSVLSVAFTFHKEDYLNLINMLLIKFNNLFPESVFYVLENKGDNLNIISVINEGDVKIDPVKIKEIISSSKDELSYLERTDVFEGEKICFVVISIKDEMKNIFVVAVIDENEKEIVIRYFKFIVLFLKVFLNYYSEIEKRNREIKRLKIEVDGIVKELESQESKLIKKHKEQKLIYEGISTLNSDLENPASYLIDLIYKTVLPELIVCFCYSENENKLLPLFVKPQNLKLDYEIDLTNNNSFFTRAFLSGNPLYITDKDDIDKISFLKDRGINSILIFPVMTSKIKYGIIVICDKKHKRYTNDDLSLIDITVKQLALLMNFSDLYSKISHYAAKLENLNRIKDDFIASVNHEIKTPLTTIKGFLSVLLSGDTGSLNDQQLSFLNLIDQATNRLINIVSNLLDISKLNSRGDMEFEKVDLVEFINTILPSLRMKAYSRNIRIVFNSDLKSAYANIDRHWIGQVINNLIDNAIKYSPPSSIITVSLYDRGDVVVFCVEDQGYGIDEDDKKFIFEKFFRGKNVSFNTEGSGLGLSIVKTIIDKHNGKVWFESEKGKGSKFYFAIKKV